MTNIVNTVNDYILKNVLSDSGIEVIYNDIFPDAEGAVLMARHDPSQAKTRSFIDGSSTGTLQIAYYMRSDDAVTCRTVLNEIVEKMDGVHLSEENLLMDVEAQTLPNFVMVDDKANTIYTAEIAVNYIN